MELGTPNMQAGVYIQLQYGFFSFSVSPCSLTLLPKDKQDLRKPYYFHYLKNLHGHHSLLTLLPVQVNGNCWFLAGLYLLMSSAELVVQASFDKLIFKVTKQIAS